MEIRCSQDEGALVELEGAWEALHALSVTATVFNSIAFVRVWWRHFGAPGTLQLWTAWEDGALAAVAPLYVTTDAEGVAVRRFVGGVDVADYLDLLAAPGCEEDVVAALLRAWGAGRDRPALDLHDLRAASPVRAALRRLAPEYGFRIDEAQEETCMAMALPATFDEYLAGLDSKQRHEVRRKLRKAEREAQVEWYRVPPGNVAAEMEHFFDLHVKSDPLKAEFMDGRMRAFFVDLAVACAERGWLELVFLRVDGGCAATYLCFAFRNEIQLYNSGYDPAAYGAFSPGWVLLARHIEAAIADGRARYDFMRGTEDYKARFGGKPEPVYVMRLE